MQRERFSRHQRDHHGHDIAVCSDPDSVWYPQRIICRADMERAAAEWRYDQLHENRPFHDGTFKSWREERSLTHPYHFRDGVDIVVAETNLDPDDDFLASTRGDAPL